jgi:3-oxoacyl-[acyl-carrier protein] reductase
VAHRAPSGIAEARALVVGSTPSLEPIATGLRQHGLAVTTTEATAGYDGALDAAEAAIGALDVTVWAATPAALGRSVSLDAVDEPTWTSLVGSTLRSYVEFLQAVERRLRARGGRIVVVIPTTAITGAANLVAWSTVAEGQRALAKSVARVWGTNGITVNCVAVEPSLLVANDVDRPNLQAAALPDADLRDVAGVIAALCGNGFGAVTGATIGVDGGRWIAS